MYTILGRGSPIDKTHKKKLYLPLGKNMLADVAAGLQHVSSGGDTCVAASCPELRALLLLHELQLLQMLVRVVAEMRPRS